MHVEASLGVEADFLRNLERLKETGEGKWIACCPAHDDKSPSLSITYKRGGSKEWLFHCHAGCSQTAVMSAINYRPRQSNENLVEAIYKYTDPLGVLEFEVVRYKGKKFRQRKPNDTGGWTYSRKGTTDYLYRLPELVADTDSMVVLCEGEKDVERGAKFGLLTTTKAGGAKNFNSGHADQLRGRDVVIVPDNDKAGESFATEAAAHLLGVARSVKILRLPDLKAKQDLTDWFDNGGDLEQFKILAESAAPYNRDDGGQESDATFVVKRRCEMSEEPPEFLVEGVMVAGEPMMIAGPDKSFKTTTMLDLSVSLASGENFLGPDGYPVKRAVNTLVMSGETVENIIRRNAESIAKSKGIQFPDERWFYCGQIPFLDQAGQRTLLEIDVIKKYEIEVLMIDPTYFAISADQTSQAAVGAVLREFNRICRKYGVTSILAHHTKKKTSEDCKPLSKSDLIGAGYGSFMAQWILANLRSPFRQLGTNKIRYQFAGRSFTGHTCHVDIDEGRDPNDPLRYDYSVLSVDRDAREAKSDFHPVLDDRIIDVLNGAEENFMSTQKLAEACKTTAQRGEFKDAVIKLQEVGTIEKVKIKTSSMKQRYDGYKLTDAYLSGEDLF